MYRVVRFPLMTAAVTFVVLIVAIPLITYTTLFKNRMSPDPHGVGAFVFILFVGLINPLISILISICVWLAMRGRSRKLP